jgi:hypothetical protein
MECAFVRFDIQLVLQKTLEDLPITADMFLWRVGKHEDIIKVDEYEPVQHVPENVVYQGLEHSRSVGQSKRYHQVFVVPANCVKVGLPLIPLPDLYHMVGVPGVQLGEDGSPWRGLNAEVMSGTG